MKKNISNLLWGLLFIFVGVSLLGNLFDLWDFNLFFDGWWTLFLIIPALVSMIQSGIRIGNAIVLGIGVLLLLEQQDVLPLSALYKYAAPAVLIIIGVSIIFNGFMKKKPTSSSESDTKTVTGDSGKVVSEDYPSYMALFSGNKVRNISTNFQGGNATSIFGGCDIDLRNVVLVKDVEFNVTSIFGGTEIKAPSNAKVTITGFPIFGDNDNNAVSSEDPNAFKITFNCITLFGGTEIK